MGHLLSICLIYACVVTYDSKIAGPSGQLARLQPVSQYQLVQSEDPRIKQIQGYLRARKSPLSDSAGHFVSVGKKYNIDPYLLVAISGKESSFGRRQCADYNAWGYGNPCIGFSSYREAIEQICKTIMGGRAYRMFQSSGQVRDLGPVYNKPVGYEDWVEDVTWFIEEIKRHQDQPTNVFGKI